MKVPYCFRQLNEKEFQAQAPSSIVREKKYRMLVISEHQLEARMPCAIVSGRLESVGRLGLATKARDQKERNKRNIYAGDYRKVQSTGTR